MRIKFRAILSGMNIDFNLEAKKYENQIATVESRKIAICKIGNDLT